MITNEQNHYCLWLNFSVGFSTFICSSVLAAALVGRGPSVCANRVRICCLETLRSEGRGGGGLEQHHTFPRTPFRQATF